MPDRELFEDKILDLYEEKKLLEEQRRLQGRLTWISFWGGCPFKSGDVCLRVGNLGAVCVEPGEICSAYNEVFWERSAEYGKFQATALRNQSGAL